MLMIPIHLCWPFALAFGLGAPSFSLYFNSPPRPIARPYLWLSLPQNSAFSVFGPLYRGAQKPSSTYLCAALTDFQQDPQLLERQRQRLSLPLSPI